MSSAAILAVYAAGFTRTRAAARRLEAQAEVRTPAPTGMVRPPAATPVVPGVAPVAAVTVPRPGGRGALPPVSAGPQSTPPAANTPAAPATPALPDPPAITAPVPAAAPVPVVAATPAPPPAPAAPTWKDGTYTGWGSSRHGDIQAEVVVDNGKIASARIAQCLTRYSCDVIVRLPPEVPLRQSPDVDYVSGATQSANAFYFAVVDALSKAK